MKQIKTAANEPLGGDRFDTKPYRNLLLIISAVLLISFLIVTINQAAQLVQLASSADPLLGRIVLVVLALLALAAVFFTTVLLVSLDKPLPVPGEEDPAAYAAYLAKLRKRLQRNRFLKKTGFGWDPQTSDADAVAAALHVLEQESRRIVKSSAGAVFITTSVSQNGTLDSLFVFTAVMRLVWRIAMLYSQRPAIRDLVNLYANVFATVLLTRQIDDLDLVAEQLEPVLTALFGGVVGSMVPGVNYVTSFVVDSVIEGSLNTLLTLRAGIIAQQYCGSTVRKERRTISRTATYQACEMLGSIVGENSKRISEALLKAVRNAATDTISQSRNKITGVFERLFGKDAEGTV